MTFIRRRIDVSFKLANGQFAETGGSSVKVSGLRVSARVDNAAGIVKVGLNMQIFGLPLSMMNRLSTLGMKIQDGTRNSVVVEAGDDLAGMSKVFEGHIVWAYADFTNQPQVPLVIQAFGLYNDALAPAQPSSFKGAKDVADLAKGVVARMNNGAGYPFFNNGVSFTLMNPYLWGPLYQQLDQLRTAANFAWNGGGDGTIRVWPRNGDNGLGTVVVSARTGMVGSPSFTSEGIVVRTIFNPAVRQGSKLNIFSEVVPVPQGAWNVYYVNHALDAQMPKGEWFTTLYATSPENPSAAPPGPQPTGGT